ncbi:MAG TPA: hypothetical protein VGL93_09285 [Streptosporangiaceae bacterium]|jgi:hypothetical protein
MVESIAVGTQVTVPSVFVVATSAPPAEPVALAARHLHPRLARPVISAARELIAGPLLHGAVHPSDISPWRSTLLAAARTPALRDRLRAATHHLVLTAHSPPHAHPAHAQATRALARALAFATDGVVHDPLTATLIGPAARGDIEPPAFRLADDWLSTAIAPSDPGPPSEPAPPPDPGPPSGPDPLRDPSPPCASGPLRASGSPREPSPLCPSSPPSGAAPSRDPGPPSGSGLPSSPHPTSGPGAPERVVEATTRGLARFGVPELVIGAVRAEHLLTAVSLLRGVAVHLLAEHWAWLAAGGRGPRMVDARPRIGAAEMHQYWGRLGLDLWRGAHPSSPAPGESVEVRLEPAPSARAEAGDPDGGGAAAAPGDVTAGAPCVRVAPPGAGGAAETAAWLSGRVDAIRPRIDPAGVEARLGSGEAEGGGVQPVQKRKS